MSKYKAYSYPRVNTSVTALEHVNSAPSAEDTTVLFVPFVSEKGPINEVKKIHSLEEFQATYGEIKNYVNRIGKHTAFNIMNWLTAGGTIYACRLGDDTAKKAPIFSNDAIKFIGKEFGSYINDFSISLSVNTDKDNKKTGYINIKSGSSTIERIYISEFPKVNQPLKLKSEYLDSLELTADGIADDVNITVKDADKGTDGLDKLEFNVLLKIFWNGAKEDESVTQNVPFAKDIIGNSLETPIDLIMDAGYPNDVKLAMMNFIADYDKDGTERSAKDQPDRPDIRGYFEIFEADEASKDIDTSIEYIKEFNKDPNIFTYPQSLKINDGIFSNDEIEVGPTYYLSKLIPANDLNNGIQFPVAGKRRAELDNVNSISWNPMPGDKEKLFNARINYIEKDSRGYYFMSERTMEAKNNNGNNTALSFIHNSRVVCRMVHELEALGRDYLFEFNDSVTLSNMSAVLNKYLSTWIANRTLSYGEILVSKNENSDEAVDVSLNIKFTGTIEVISIDIVIQ